MGSHVIVHLDQNYLSNMAKARIGLIEDESLTKCWSSLFSDLRKAALDDKIACPEVEFHTTEAMYDKRLEEPIRQVIDELSWGLKFRQRGDILETLIRGAASKFLGRNEGTKETWTIAFESDPQAPVHSRMQDIGEIEGQINVHLPTPDWVVEHDRQLKNKYVKGEELFAKLGNVCRDWDDEVLAQKMDFINSFFLGGQDINSIDKQEHLIDLWGKLGEIGIKDSDIDTATKFLKSEELLNTPYIHICSSINAAIAKHYPHPQRRCKGSDLYDVPALATALPYCDVVTTDNFMKEILVKILHFDDKYEAMKFSATKEDLLAFQKFIRELK
jgi:hypothetical protein